MSFLLPSGRSVELHEPTFGEELAVVAASHDDLAELMYAKCAVIVPEFSRDEIAALPRLDGRALVVEVGRIWDGGRPEDQEAPFESGSNTPSTDSIPSETATPPA